MAQRHMPLGFDEIGDHRAPPRHPVSAWIVIALVLITASVGFALDHVVAIAP